MRGDEEQWRWVILFGRLESGPSGEPVRLHLCLRDATSEHTTEDQLRELARRAESEREADRAKLARELHDQIGQWLTAIRMDADRLLSLHRKGAALAAAELAERLTMIKDIASDSIKAVQRICQELRSSAVSELGLVSAVRSAADALETRTGIRCRAVLPENELEFDGERCRVLCRALHEALTNVIRHAQASEVRIALREEDGTIELEIADNGRGLPAGALSAPTSIGLFGLHERAQALGGEAAINSSPEGGTVVMLRVPARLPEVNGQLVQA
jgi:signal transduction histidine kinase